MAWRYAPVAGPQGPGRWQVNPRHVIIAALAETVVRDVATLGYAYLDDSLALDAEGMAALVTAAAEQAGPRVGVLIERQDFGTTLSLVVA